MNKRFSEKRRQQIENVLAKSRNRRKPASIASLKKLSVPESVDRFIENRDALREHEKKARACSKELIAAGELRIARHFLEAPADLKDLADLLFYGEPILMLTDKKTETKGAPTAASFPKKFKLKHSKVTKSFEFPSAHAEQIADTAAAKVKSKIIERFRKGLRETADVLKKFPELLSDGSMPSAGRDSYDLKFSQTKMIREQAIETAWLYPLEEWAMIFPDAALAGDCDFIIRVVDRCKNPPKALDSINSLIAVSWHGFEQLKLADRVPPLKYWSDQAACEFVSFMMGKDIALTTYKNRKSDLRLHSEKPTLVSEARIENGELVCRR